MDSKVRLEAIMELARRYNYDAGHAHQVECLAGTLFMEIAEFISSIGATASCWSLPPSSTTSATSFRPRGTTGTR